MVAEAKTIGREEQERRVPDRPLTYEEFLEWTDGMFAEWVDGEVVYTAAASLTHSTLSVFLSRVLAEYVEERDLGQVLNAPYNMRLRNVRRGREPDICFIAHENLGCLKPMYLDGPADLAVEIVSPDSVRRDYEDKLSEYEREGVREYWIIDPLTSQTKFYVLEDGRYRTASVDAAGIYRSTVLEGFWLNVNWLWQEPLPTLRQVMRHYD